MATFRINVNAWLDSVLNFKKYTANNQGKLLVIAAKRYLRFLKNRYAAMSAGTGSWPDIQEVTVKRKQKRMSERGWLGNATWILRESQTLINSMSIRIGPKRVEVGYIVDKMHARDEGYTVFEIVEYHQPLRPIIVRPDGKTLRNMVRDIKKELEREIGRERRKGRKRK